VGAASAGREGRMSRPRLLDLFCGAGGCSVGYHRAGFDVVGVDLKPQPNYPFEFHQADALTFPLEGFDAIHASPPCQAHVKGLGAVNAKLGRSVKYGDLIPATRERLRAAGVPYVIENVEGAPLVNAVKLCGSSFGLAVRRHRLFESNVGILAPPCAHHLQTERKFWTSVSAHRGDDRYTSTVVQVYGNGGGSEHWAAAMGIDWMDKAGLTQAIPPAYCEHIGLYLMAAVTELADAA
jgi:DNA (cytosine-5)-methyltransferase 1